MIERVLSGGQTGAEQAGWAAARVSGVATGGWMPRGFLTEAGPRPEFADLYGARETLYPTRTRLNVEQADVTVWFGDPLSEDGLATAQTCLGRGKPRLTVYTPKAPRPARLADELRALASHRTLHVAGDRESEAPGIGGWVEQYLVEVFRILRGEG